MHIAVDARELGGRPTGVGTYLTRLLDEWARLPQASVHRWSLYTPEMGSGTFSRAEMGSGTFLREQLCQTPFSVREVRGRGGTWWEQRALAAALRRDKPDVLFAPGYTAPLAMRVPVVLTVHDVSFFAHPEWFSRREGLRRRMLTRQSARRARLVLTDSEFSRQEILRRVRVPADRVQVIRLGIPPPPVVPAAAFRPLTLLFVGSILNRRRVPDLVRAFAALAPDLPEARLELVGDNRTRPFQDLDALVCSLGIRDRVAVRSYVSDEVLARLYSEARAFAFLSEYEGFGLTPLEALAHGVPVVVLDTPIAREVYEDAALYVRPGDIEATTAALRRLLTDAAARDAQLACAARLLPRYSWPDAARATLAAIERGAACQS
jgi:glycosyltransferase involved in cell wall biosynthesis